tara:strand:+ start:8495 stop:9142 length:648 start_codon:yes stop_codon:yes gene_type:complete
MHNPHDIRIFNRDGLVSALVITTEPDTFKDFQSSSSEKSDNFYILRFEGSNVIDLAMTFIENIKYAHEINLITQSNFVPFKYKLLHENAQPPQRARPSESGYDLAIINVNKMIGNVTLYGTGVSVQPPGGFYFDLVPRSSIIKSGYLLANGIGVIDQGYTGEILVPLVKIDANAPDLELPCKLVQLIPRRWHGLTPIESQPDTTTRGSDGFGSTS